ncbi:MAG: DUF2344 domain-containing protein [Ruminococcaceae bacterium]|nr:DUF2344 domain-containing protein [Oscillospiraceae bacterium]
MYKYIVRYAKEGDAKFVSHLDFLRLIQRAMRRANLPLKFSEGFNPHPCLSFAHPLGVGITGKRELFEVEMTEPCPLLAEQLAPKMPRGIQIVEAFPCEKNRFSDVARAVYTVLPTQLPTEEQLKAFLEKPEILTEKKTKSGIKTADIRPDIFRAEIRENLLILCLAAGSNANLKPATFMEALAEQIPDYTPGYCRYTRLCLTDRENNEI